jgi:hypothetical protein
MWQEKKNMQFTRDIKIIQSHRLSINGVVNLPYNYPLKQTEQINLQIQKN